MFHLNQFKKMRSLLTILGLMYLSFGYSQSTRDTVFLKKEKFETLYLTHDTSIHDYKWLVPADLNVRNLSIYMDYFTGLLKDTVIKIKHFDFGNLPLKWSPIYMIKTKYYLYSPSDWMFSFGFVINDSIVLRQYSDDPGALIILDYMQKSNNEYFFKLRTLQGIEYLTIKIIDAKLGIAVWKFVGNDYWKYRLMVNSNNVKQFPMVKCNCGENKCVTEYKFEELDYEDIISNAH